MRGGAGARGQVGLHPPLRGREVRARGRLQHPPAVDPEGLRHPDLSVRPAASAEDYDSSRLEMTIVLYSLAFRTILSNAYLSTGLMAFKCNPFSFFIVYIQNCVVTPRGMCDVPNNHYSVLSSAHVPLCPRDMHISPSLHNIITLITRLGAYLDHVIRGLSKGE